MDWEKLAENFKNDIRNAKNASDIEVLRIKYLGRKSELAEFFGGLNVLPIETRKMAGQRANEAREKIGAILDKKAQEFREKEKNNLNATNKIDITIPGKKIELGHLHILTKLINQIEAIFASMGFEIAEGPEIEDEYHNFDALNIPKNHPARDAWDTFWLRQNEIKNQKSKIKNDGKLLLRTHTSPAQIRYMETKNPPFRIIAPGRIYRYEATDASHSHTFYQLEGLMVDKDVSLANLKFIIEEFFRKLFKNDIQFKFCPSYYPFVEPGIDVYMKWQNKWLEVAGAGMVHPNVFKAVGYVPGDWRGFAFGFGIDRLAMIKYNIPDIRLLYSGDLRFIRQF